VGDKHLKLRLMLGKNLIDAIAFFVDTAQWPNHRCELLRAAYRLDVNEYKGSSRVQLIIEYMEAVHE
jgi:single-stranded-DNA-specific exonuclease